MTSVPKSCKFQAELEALFVSGGEATPEATLAARAHMADCAACQETYDLLAMASRELEARELSGFEVAFTEAGIFEELDALDSAGGSAANDDDDEAYIRSKVGPTWPIYLVAASVAAILGGGMTYIAFQRIPDPDEFQARSAVQVIPAPEERPQIELFCTERGQGESEDVRFRGTADVPFGALDCPIGAELKLAYSNPDSRYRYGAFFGVSEAGQLYWYGPSPADGAPMHIKTSKDLEPIGESIRLKVNHKEGLVRVHGIFSSTPIEHSRLSGLLDKVPGTQLFYAPTLDAWLDEGMSSSRTFEITGGAR